jgi:hypothetical protein
LKVPKLRQAKFETAIIERYKRRESSVEEALIEMYLAGVIVIDQSNISSESGGNGVIGPDVQRREAAQTFSILNTGTLSTIELFGFRRQYDSGGLIIDIRPVGLDGLPVEDNAAAVFSVTIADSDPSLDSQATPLLIDGLGLTVVEGEQWAVVARAISGAYHWNMNREVYTEGRSAVRGVISEQELGSPEAWLMSNSNARDFLFRTFVECSNDDSCDEYSNPQPVPEPSTLAILTLVSPSCRAQVLGHTVL